MSKRFLFTTAFAGAASLLSAQFMGSPAAAYYFYPPLQRLSKGNLLLLEQISRPYLLGNGIAMVAQQTAHPWAALGYTARGDASIYQNLLLDFRVSDLGEMAVSHIFNAKDITWQGHWSGLNRRIDRNRDRFLDVPLHQIAYNKLEYSDYAKKWFVRAFVSHLYQNEQGGRTSFYHPSDYLSLQDYGTGLALHDLNAFARLSRKWGYRNQHHFWGWLESNYQQQRAYFGQRLYTGERLTAEAQTSYTWENKGAFDTWSFQGSYFYRQNTETLDSAGQRQVHLVRPEQQAMAFVGLKTMLAEGLRLQLGLDGGYHQLAGAVLLPQFNLVYQPASWLQAKLYGSRGLAYLNPLAQYRDWLLTAKKVTMLERLRPDAAWVYGLQLNYQQYLGVHWNVVLDVGSRHYTNSLIADLDTDPHRLLFYNGKAQQQWLALDARAYQSYGRWGTFALSLGYYWNQLQQRQRDGERRLALLHPAHRWMLGFSWEHAYFRFFTEGYAFSPQRLLDGERSAWGHRWDLRLELPISDYVNFNDKGDKGDKLRRRLNFTLYLGVENLLDARQKNPFVRPDAPFSSDFDGAMRWMTTVPRRFLVGLRWKWR